MLSIVRMKSLKELNMNYASKPNELEMAITDRGIALLANSSFESLYLSGTQVTTASLPTFKTMKHLRRLYMPAGQAPLSFFSEMHRAIPGILVLDE